MRLEMYLDGPSISMNVLMPESWLNGGVSSGKTVWLLHDKMDLASDWLSFTQAELYAEQASVAFVCVSTISARYTNWQGGCTWETFFTQDMWDYVHEIFPILSRRPEDNLLFGYGRGGFGAIKYALTYPEKYGAAYSVAYNDQPVLDAMLAWANDLVKKTAPKSHLGRALNYLIEQWPYLIRYLEDGRLEISNNRALCAS